MSNLSFEWVSGVSNWIPRVSSVAYTSVSTVDGAVRCSSSDTSQGKTLIDDLNGVYGDFEVEIEIYFQHDYQNRQHFGFWVYSGENPTDNTKAVKMNGLDDNFGFTQWLGKESTELRLGIEDFVVENPPLIGFQVGETYTFKIKKENGLFSLFEVQGVISNNDIADYMLEALDGSFVSIGIFNYGCAVDIKRIKVISSEAETKIIGAANAIWSNKETSEQANPYPHKVQNLSQGSDISLIGKSGNYSNILDKNGNQRPIGYYESTVLINNVPTANRRVMCLTNNGQLIDETVSDSEGAYRFDHLDLNKKYMFVAQYSNELNTPPDYTAVAADWQTPTPYKE